VTIDDMILNIIRCQYCGKNYVNHDVLATYCCPECREKMRPREKDTQ